METFSPNFLATNFALDRATVLRALAGIEPSAKTKGRDTYTIAVFAAALDSHRARNSSNANDGNGEISDTASLIAARVRVTIANAEAKELANNITKGRFVDHMVVLDLLTPVFLTMREIALSMPGKICDELMQLCIEEMKRGDQFDPVRLRSSIFEIVNREVRENLTNLASPESYASAAETFNKSQGVVRPDVEGEAAP